MKDNWITHNTDKMLLFILVLVLIGLNMHIAHHDAENMQTVTWAQGAFSTVLGALILILTGRIQRADNQTASGTPPTPDTASKPQEPISNAPGS